MTLSAKDFADKVTVADGAWGTELDKLARRATVIPQSVRLAQDKPERFTDYVLSVEMTIQLRDSMKSISRFLKTIDEGELAFSWKTCTIRPDNPKDPKQAVLNGKIQALILSSEASELLSSGGM